MANELGYPENQIQDAGSAAEAAVRMGVTRIQRKVSSEYGTPGIDPVIPGRKCADCKEEISLKRLEAIPLARRCRDCEEKFKGES